MLKQGFASLAVMISASSAGNAESNNALAGYDISSFESHQMQIAVATDRKSGHRFNVVKLPNGNMMVLMSATKVMGLTPFSDDSDMIPNGSRR